MSPMHRASEMSSGLAGPGSGTTELSHAGLSANLESHLTGHGFIQPRADIGLLSAAPVPSGMEASALGAAQGAAAGQVSPILQMIMRMPGHIGILSGFFEALGQFFAPAAELFQGFDLSEIMAQAQDAAGSALASVGEHLPIDPSLLPADAPIFQQVSVKDLLTGNGQFHNVNVAGGISPGKPLFEAGSQSLTSAGKSFISKDLGLLSGPSMTNNLSNHLSGNHRLFVDRLDTISRTGSNYAGGSLAANNASCGLNVGASPFTQSAGSLPAMAQIKDGLVNQQAIDLGKLGPSGAVSDRLGEQQLLAANTPGSDSQTLANASIPESSTLSTNSGAADASTAADGPQPVELKAKQLSLKDMQASKSAAHDTAAATKASTHNLSKHASAAQPTKHPAVDKIAHRSSPALKSTHPSLSKSHPAVGAAKPAETLPAVESQPAASVPADNLAATPESSTASDCTTYTVASGDNLWNIAKQHLGDGSRWQEIYKLNQDVLGSNPELIHPGTTLQLPGAPSDIASASGAADASIYTVQPGDNLWDIAKTHMGGGQNWSQIYNANSGIIGSNPGIIHPGQQLSLPGTAPTQISAAPQAVDAGNIPVEPSAAPPTIPPPNPAFGSPNTSALPSGQPVASAATPESSFLPSAQAAPAATSSSAIVAKSLRPDLSFLTGKAGK